MTNFERIANNIDEMAELLNGVCQDCDYCPAKDMCGCDYGNCSEMFKEWLESDDGTDDEDLLPSDCLYIKGFLEVNYDGIYSTDESSDSIINRIENYAESHGLFGHTRKGLGGRRAIIDDCNMRAYFTNEKCTLVAAQMARDNFMYGGDLKTQVTYEGYSEWTITGLDLDEFTIGGHDLKSEFSSHVGKYMHLIIECN